MILMVISNFKIPKNMSFTAQLFIHCNCFSVDKFNFKYDFKHILLINFCNDDRDQML